MNANSIRYRKAELEEFAHNTKPDLILVTETKIVESIRSSEFLPTDYRVNIRTGCTSDGVL